MAKFELTKADISKINKDFKANPDQYGKQPFKRIQSLLKSRLKGSKSPHITVMHAYNKCDQTLFNKDLKHLLNPDKKAPSKVKGSSETVSLIKSVEMMIQTQSKLCAELADRVAEIDFIEQGGLNLVLARIEAEAEKAKLDALKRIQEKLR